MPDAADPGQVTALGLLRSTWTLLRGRLLAVLVLMSLQDAAIFACQRLADFVTNHGDSVTSFLCMHAYGMEMTMPSRVACLDQVDAAGDCDILTR